MNESCRVFIDNEPYHFDVDGDFFWGDKTLLFDEATSPISKMAWKNEGFGIIQAFSDSEFLKLKTSITQIIIKALKAHVSDFEENTFTLEKYHEVITTDELHNKVIDITRNLENSDFDFDIEVLVKHFSQVLGFEFTSYIEELKKTHIQIRISRPNSLDINPPHRDGYLSYYQDIVNVWIPIHGCNSLSSLPVLPGSHLIPEHEILRTESKGAKINGNTYYVPCILKTKEGDMHMIRPNPKPGEALVFTPYLIHGSAVNKNPDQTRFSLELRFPRVN
ncbi:MAG: phytanoyl-CoA dioxygenase family protein [Ignavibacteriae bacterium]|nr:phytanoyl-CoA dioxygenase family protein [Ignavibacteriota bacterium]